MPYPPAMLGLLPEIEAALRSLVESLDAPAELKEAMAYSLLAGGKRLRPALVLTVHELLPACSPDPMPAACALELIHTYSLIHDDLPAMDDDDLRRGQPSCHVRFGEATAILAGDALLTEAFALLGDSYGGEQAALGLRLVAEIAGAAGAGGMVGGQILDMHSSRTQITRQALERLHSLKTGKLFRAAARCGALLGGATAGELEALTTYSERVGLAFQVADGILDATATTEAMGKTVGKDARQDKSTYVSLLGLQGARRLAERLKIAAVEALTPFGTAADTLRELAAFTVERTS